MKIFGIEINSSKEIKALRENFADVERKLEDIGWVGLNQSYDQSQFLTKENYSLMIKRSRLAYIKSPIVGQAVNITTNYTFGEGVQVPKSDDEMVQEIINAFWNDPDNRLSFSSELSQQKLSNKLQIDGEIMFLCQVDVDGSVYVRIIDSITVGDIKTDPYDNMRPLFYKRRIKETDQYIPDWKNGTAFLRDEKIDEWNALLKTFGIKDNEVPKDMYIYHVKINNDILDKRGIPEIYRALDFMNANAKINSDMASFINAQSQYAWEKKISGSKNQIDALKAVYNQNSELTNPSKRGGSTILSNGLVENKAIALPSSSGELFDIGIRRTLLMVSSAFGIMEHYFGDAGNANLATATAMELPMLKKFQARQKLWEGIYRDLINFAIDMNLFYTNHKSFDYYPMKNRIIISPSRDVDRTIDIDFPPILQKDLQSTSQALINSKNSGLIPVDTSRRSMMQALGINNIDEEMEKEFQEPVSNQPFNPYDQPAKESVSDTEIVKNKKNAVRLSDKNKETIRRMNGYLKEIAGAYNKFRAKIKDKAGVTPYGDKNIAHVVGYDKLIDAFITDMGSLGRRYLPIAAKIGENYVKSRSLKETNKRIIEARIDSFIERQIEWNDKYLDESLAPDMKKKISSLFNVEYDTEEEFLDELDRALGSYEKRVGSYAGAFWTVEERAVKESGDSGQTAYFVGVDDNDNCPGCQEGLSGNPWTLSEIPVPGEQDCLGNCRHAIQLQDDEPLTEADIDLLRDAERSATKGLEVASI